MKVLKIFILIISFLVLPYQAKNDNSPLINWIREQEVKRCKYEIKRYDVIMKVLPDVLVYKGFYGDSAIKIAMTSKDSTIYCIRVNLTDILVEMYDQCQQYDIDIDKAIRWIGAESSFNPWAISPTGAKGLGQIVKSTAEQIADSLDLEDYDLFNYKTNLQMSFYWLSLLKKRHNNYDYAFAEYLQGNEWAFYTDCDYVKKIVD